MQCLNLIAMILVLISNIILVYSYFKSKDELELYVSLQKILSKFEGNENVRNQLLSVIAKATKDNQNNPNSSIKHKKTKEIKEIIKNYDDNKYELVGAEIFISNRFLFLMGIVFLATLFYILSFFSIFDTSFNIFGIKFDFYKFLVFRIIILILSILIPGLCWTWFKIGVKKIFLKCKVYLKRKTK